MTSFSRGQSPLELFWQGKWFIGAPPPVPVGGNDFPRTPSIGELHLLRYWRQYAGPNLSSEEIFLGSGDALRCNAGICPSGAFRPDRIPKTSLHSAGILSKISVSATLRIVGRRYPPKVSPTLICKVFGKQSIAVQTTDDLYPGSRPAILLPVPANRGEYREDHHLERF